MSANGQTQDPKALLAELDARFRAPLMAFFLRRVGNRSEAEDLTQETFVRLIGSHSFEQAEQANAYVFRVASNLLRDRARTAVRWKKHPHSPVDPQTIDQFARQFVEDRGPERVLIGRESLVEVLRNLDELGERTKSIFILFRLEGMKQKDIAALYGIGVSTVEKHVMQAMLHLAKRFGSRAP
ncbi:MAG: sigma-70 family RNA polymerase sigma factor [Rhizomicrobium sp.]